MPKYLSLAIRFSQLFLELFQLQHQNSTSICSRLSKTSSSTFDLPIIAFEILENTDFFVFSNPLSNVSFLSLEKNEKNSHIVFFMLNIWLK